MSNILRFGIPSLDCLFGGAETEGAKTGQAKTGQRRQGILLPGGNNDQNRSNSSVSICMSGPDGTGKSVMALHLASRYLADCCDYTPMEQPLPKVLYVSTDLRFEMAKKMWVNFGLDWPNRRTIPFGKLKMGKDELLKVKLLPCLPLGTREKNSAPEIGEGKAPRPLSYCLSGDHLSRGSRKAEIYFVDLASHTAGDDWGFVNRVLSVLERPPDQQPRHIMILDSVEGFEMLVGERDAFGEMQTRRSRVAQIMRSAGDKCHVLFVVEEPEEGRRLPEEFVTDVVIRLRSVLIKDYVRRTLEIEKARGHSQVRGQHYYVIRSGKGSTTGRQENHDDPHIFAGDREDEDQRMRPSNQSYLHICHSLHHLNREIMELEGPGRPATLPDRFAAFGIRYLDDMLDGKREDCSRTNGDDQRGLRCSTTTALIGNSVTQKSPLGIAFLSRCFRSYAQKFFDLTKELETDPERVRRILEAARQARRESDGRKEGWLRNNCQRRERVFERLQNVKVITKAESVLTRDDKEREKLRRKMLNLAKAPESDVEKALGTYFELGDDISESEKEDVKSAGERKIVMAVDELVQAAAWEIGSPKYPNDGVPVLLATQDVHAQKLARDFLPWLLRKTPELRNQDESHPGCLAALRILMEEYTICRRLEIHDLPSAVLIHIVRCAVEAAQRILFENNPPENTERRFDISWGIRVMIDDFSILKNTYIEIRDEPLLLRFLLFYLGREGVTTLLIDTQAGPPDMTAPNSLDNELRSLVDHRIYTWRFSFYGENRVAIAAIPPISPQWPAVIRELRQGVGGGTGPDAAPLVVDPHFELYSGIETGEPRQIPLEIRLFEETPAFKKYIEQEEPQYRELFVPPPQNEQGGNGRIIISVPVCNYERLRDFCYLQKDTRLDHSLIFQLDEFWVMRRPGLRRAGAFRPQWKYLNAIVEVDSHDEKYSKREWAIDTFRLFQKTLWNKERAANQGERPDVGAAANEAVTDIAKTKKDKWHRRWQEFVWHGYRLDRRDEYAQESIDYAQESIDRVPFMWDFGFLLCKVRPWEDSADKALSFWNENEKEKTKHTVGKEKTEHTVYTVGKVWSEMPKAIKGLPQHQEGRPSWRLFLEACYQVAQAQTYAKSKPVSAFDLHISADPVLSCLVLEIWASEIYKTPESREKVVAQVSERNWRQQEQGLIEWLKEYQLQLFKTWLLLVEVLDIHQLAESIRNDHLRLREPDPSTIAVRHWYKTASHFTRNLSLDDAFVPVGLPGHFSVRGDWFLAVAGGSRSGRLADRALDLLNSRRANYERLKLGLGLPTRRLVSDRLRTNIVTIDFGEKLEEPYQEHLSRDDKRARRLSRVWYSNLTRIGGPLKEPLFEPQEFHWFWRSGLAHYHRHARIWQDWLSQMILWWERVRFIARDKWMNGFQRYDEMETAEMAGKGLSDYRDGSGNPLEPWIRFRTLCGYLIEELEQATPLEEE